MLQCIMYVQGWIGRNHCIARRHCTKEVYTRTVQQLILKRSALYIMVHFDLVCPIYTPTRQAEAKAEDKEDDCLGGSDIGSVRTP